MRSRLFRAGDWVQIRDWDDMAAEFGVIDDSIPCQSTFIWVMRPFCGLIGRLSSVDALHVIVQFDSFNPLLHRSRFTFSTDMLKKIRPLSFVEEDVR